MVDFRPLLFINALALMLLVTAGFASVTEEIAGTAGTIQQEPQQKPQQKPELGEAVAAANQKDDSVFLNEEPPAAVNAGSTESNEGKAQRRETKAAPFSIGTAPENATLIAMAEPVAALIPTMTDATPAPSEPALQPKARAPVAKEPEPPMSKTGRLVLRSNVVADQVSVNGKNYGATRLDLELKPGTYDVVIRKNGHQPWQRTVTLNAGDETTLVGQLDAITNVNYRNGTWVGGVKTGDGTLHNSKGLKYEGHFVDGKFHGEGTAWYPDGSKYEGDWRSGQRHGEGSWRGAGDTRYTGQFRNDQFSGQGTLTMANGDILTGQGQRDGSMATAP